MIRDRIRRGWERSRDTARGRRRWRRLLLGGAVAGAAGFFLLFGPPDLMGRTETPDFCALCHSMRPQHAAWSRSAHRTARCIDCHLPNDHVVHHYVRKALDGNKDVFYEFSGLREYDDIRLSVRGRNTLQANCIRCHEGLVAHIDTRRACIDCHRAIGHRRQGVLATRERDP